MRRKHGFGRLAARGRQALGKKMFTTRVKRGWGERDWEGEMEGEGEREGDRRREAR